MNFPRNHEKHIRKQSKKTKKKNQTRTQLDLHDLEVFDIDKAETKITVTKLLHP